MIKEWVRSIFILVVALTFIEILFPGSAMGKYVGYIFALIIMATVLYPLITLLE